MKVRFLHDLLFHYFQVSIRNVLVYVPGELHDEQLLSQLTRCGLPIGLRFWVHCRYCSSTQQIVLTLEISKLVLETVNSMNTTYRHELAFSDPAGILWWSDSLSSCLLLFERVGCYSSQTCKI